ncbi:MAG: copper chaperone PCu(A)C [Pseudomonadota bacterium]
MQQGSILTTSAKSLGAALILSASMVLSGCGDDPAPVATSVEGVIEGITVENARVVLAPVEGNPAALYFDFIYEGERRFSLDRFSVAQAESAVMHAFSEYGGQMTMMEAVPVAVRSGEKVEFKPGDLHVMVMGPSPELTPGSTTEVTMKVSGGDTHVFEAEVRAAGEER